MHSDNTPRALGKAPFYEPTKSAHSRLSVQVPMDIPKGVQRSGSAGNRSPKRQWTSLWALIRNDGFDEKWISKALPEWKQVRHPIVVKLDPE